MGMKKLTPFRLLVFKAWEGYFWNATSRELASELNADETKVSEAMDFLFEYGWTKPIYGYDSGEKIVAPTGWRILSKDADIPQNHREFLHGIGWAEPRRCHGTMTPLRAMVWGGVRAIATPVTT